MYYFRRSDGKTQWDFPTDDTAATGSSLQKSELAKIIEEANRQLAEQKAAQKLEEEKKRMELELEDKEAAEVKAKERAERKSQREQSQKNRSQSDGISKLEKLLSAQVCPLWVC